MSLRLKSLELHGYKTFANRSLFEFADTVTAIVGPNGSGKSNIADSLRWVLGEQSYGLLRGKKTEDMIFAGSESRARAGMAAATITFDNADGWLPIDFSEVAITRRAYRDGSNEYLINGQKVRLKDVSELLAQSGLAERTYTVIGQGLVDAALALKADERRRLFEEAAGIGLHRARREEALRRLDATRRNLERVLDILAELKPRLSSLERQARRYIEYEQLRADLQVLLRDWYGYHWRLGQRELADARREVEIQDARLETARQAQAELERQSAELRARLMAARSELGAWHKQLSELHARRETLTRELAVLEERLGAMAGQEEAFIAEGARLDEELVFYQEQIAAAESEIAGLQSDLDEACQQRDAVQKELSARQAERRKIEAQIATHRQEIGRINARLGQLQARLMESKAQVERAGKALETAGSALAKAESEQGVAAARHARARQAARDAEEAAKTAEAALRAGREAQEALDARRRQAVEERSGLNADLARLKARQDVLEGAEASLAGYAAGSRLLLKAARDGRLKNAFGALSSFLEVPAELEKAVAAALGEYLDGVVLADDPEAALDLLRQEPGRGVLLPLTAARAAGDALADTPSGVDDAAGDVIGPALELVTCPPEALPLARALLGQVVIVRDRAAARRLLPRLAPGGRLATLGGEVFLGSGVVVGGGGGDAQGTLLGRGRQRRELSAERVRLDAELAALQQRLADLDAELEAARKETVRLGRAHDDARRAAQAAARQEDAERSALDTAGRQLQWARDQLARLQSDQARSQAEAEKLTAESAELEKKLSGERKALQAQTGRLDQLVVDDLQTQQAHWATRVAVAERAISDGRVRLSERRELTARSRKNRQDLAGRLAALSETRTSIHSRLQELQAENEVVAEAIRSLNVRIEPAEADLEAVEAQGATLQKAEAEARQSVSLVDHVNAQTRITLARRQESLQSLQRRIEEDFGLVAFEYEEKVSGPTPLPLTGMVEQLPIVKKLSPEIEESIKRQRAQLRRLGAINPEAQAEYKEVKERYEFMTAQVNDLNHAEADIRQVIDELDGLMQREFRRTFDAVAEEFRQTFTRLFGGGSARLILTDPEDLNTTGIDIQAKLPGRRTQGLALLSGGERSLTATALVFSLLKVSPTPFCVMDEVDAMLDEMNVGRFRELLRELSRTTQFVIITHNRNTVQAADVIYGITMGRDSASQVLSLKLDEVAQIVE